MIYVYRFHKEDLIRLRLPTNFFAAADLAEGKGIQGKHLRSWFISIDYMSFKP